MKQIKRDYYANNKENWSIYYTNNKDKIIDQKREWNIKVKCECGAEIHKTHKADHLKTKKHLDFINGMEKINKDCDIKVKCECGVEIQNKHMPDHLKTKNILI